MIPLAPDHNGWRCDVRNMIRQAAEELVDDEGKSVGGYASSLLQLAKNLGELAERYYAGDLQAVDEFFQAYGLDADRPKAAKANAPFKNQLVAPFTLRMTSFEQIISAGWGINTSMGGGWWFEKRDKEGTLTERQFIPYWIRQMAERYEEHGRKQLGRQIRDLINP